MRPTSPTRSVSTSLRPPRCVLRPSPIVFLLCAALSALFAPAAPAQEALNMDSATQPSPGVIYLYERARYSRYGRSPHDNNTADHTDRTTQLRLETSIIAGLTRDLALFATIPVEKRTEHTASGDSDSDFGLADPEILFKYRIYKSDSGTLDTLRIALLAGAEIPSGDGNFTSGSVDPIVGIAATTIRGRHGLNAAARFKFNTGGDDEHNLGGDGPHDALWYNASYLYRLAPGAWTATSSAALYAVLELNGLYETSGDNEILLSPGLLYEARTWAGEIGARIPILEDVNDRPEMDWGMTIGVRFLF
ncbi:MAG: transporter [Phycisphaeraceae bacterium]|nr:transporter [Phycisphaeraceae bacterium]